MLKFCLIGNPVSHSLSPKLFKAAYSSNSYIYELIETSDISDAFKHFINGKYTGMNITMPFKERIMEYVQFPDKISSVLKCANVIINRSGVLYSYNTDYDGVKLTIEETVRNIRCDNYGNNNFAHVHNALVIGLGGAGKAAALALRDSGFNVCIANRNMEKLSQFASVTGIDYIPLDEIKNIETNIGIIVYTLPVAIEQLPLSLLDGKIVLEANYAHPVLSQSDHLPIPGSYHCPGLGKFHKSYNISSSESLPIADTTFIERHESGNNTLNGTIYISGKYWLYHQAIRAFELFTGEKPDTVKMKKIIGIQ